jgi:hypothetical protein
MILLGKDTTASQRHTRSKARLPPDTQTCDGAAARRATDDLAANGIGCGQIQLQRAPLRLKIAQRIENLENVG